jgi:hypothetical protein
MKITVLYFGKTISGFPERSFTFFLNLKPLANKNFRTKISGFVSLPEMWDMMSERFFDEKISGISQIN